MPHLNAAAGVLWLNVDPSHWLYVASGGDMPACPGHAGRFRVGWSELYIEFLKFTPIDAAFIHQWWCELSATFGSFMMVFSGR